MNKIVNTGYICILIGFVFFLLSRTACPFEFIDGWLLDTIKRFSEQFGIALIIMGIISVILGFKDWQEYFKDRLKEIVMDKKYLDTLTDDELNAIQISTLKAKYKNSEMDREGSFVYYLQKRIQHYIGKAYRENVNYSMVLEESDNPAYFVSQDRLVYVCRQVGKDAITDIRWTWEKDEVVEVTKAKIVIKCPKIDDCRENNNNKENCVACKDGEIVLNQEDLVKYEVKEEEKMLGYLIPLKDVIPQTDGIRVEFTTKHKLNKNTLYTWAMTYPSKDIDLTVVFPKNYTAIEFVGGIEASEFIKNHSDGMLNFSLKGWLLPRAGIAVKFVEKIAQQNK